MIKSKIAVLGAGSWGTALALNMARNKNQQILLWGHNVEHINQLRIERQNSRYLPDNIFPDNLLLSSDINDLSDYSALLLVVPSHAFRETLIKIKSSVDIHNQEIAWAIKGFDKQSNDLLSNTFIDCFPNKNFAIVAGPSFAKEVAKNKPTAITVASQDIEFAKHYANYLSNQNMLVYLSDDIISAQIGGALKNVIAIATGIADGLDFGANARAALITRGLHEITRLCKAVGGKPETMMGLSGLGDLVLTCTDNQSRNRRFGLLLGQGKTIEEAQTIIGQTVEGIFTTQESIKFAQKYQVRLPITNVVHQILNQTLKPQDAVELLLNSTTKAELN